MKQKTRNVLAIDIGASSGRAMLACYDGGGLTLTEVHRFENVPVNLNGTLYWDVLRLWHEIKQGIAMAAKAVRLDSIGVDTWGVDFGLLDADGHLLENPVHYRDSRTHGVMQAVLEDISAKTLYDATGCGLMEINTAFQLAALQKTQPGLLAGAKSLLMMPDLFTFFLTGRQMAEASIASTSGLYNPVARQWSAPLLAQLGLPAGLFAQPTAPGTGAGMLRDELCAELDIPPCAVTSVCGHDTQSALAAVPAREEDFIFLSSGTWSLMGTELAAPVRTQMARQMNLSNESAYGGKTALLANITGLWLVQESRRQWRREGQDYTFAQLEEMARAAKPFGSYIDPGDAVFAAPGNLPRRVREFCARTGQPMPQSPGEVVRCILESLALTYRETLEKITQCTGKEYGEIHVIGGGVRDGLLCEMTACACGKPVIAGPVEATALGNALVQLVALGAVESLAAGRALVADTQEIAVYAPDGAAEWNAAYEAFKSVLQGESL